jgi:hypothetical protein
VTGPSQEDRQYMIDALKEHGSITIWRKNSAARLANDLAVEGLVTMRIVQVEEQSSYLLVEWIGDDDAAAQTHIG